MHRFQPKTADQFAVHTSGNGFSETRKASCMRWMLSHDRRDVRMLYLGGSMLNVTVACHRRPCSRNTCTCQCPYTKQIKLNAALPVRRVGVAREDF